MSRRGRKWLTAAALIVAFIGGGLLLRQQVQPEADEIRVLQVGEEAVYANEAMVYYRLMQEEFERIGTKDIWELDILGIDPRQTALDRVMESIIRVKIVQSLAGALKEREEQDIEEKAALLAEQLGAEFMERYHIDQDLLRQILRENYKAFRYEKDAKFLPGSNEEEIEQKLEETFAIYEVLDQQTYLQTAMITPMMFYTGEWVEGEWVSYSDAQKALILEEVQALYGEMSAETFREYAQTYGDSWKIEDNPVFAQGQVQNLREQYGYVYRGQIEEEVAKKIFTTRPGRMTDILETEYGYLIVKVIAFYDVTPADTEEYAKQLEASREAYRAQLMENLKAQRLEEEWRRLEEESEIQRWDDRWEEFVRAGE